MEAALMLLVSGATKTVAGIVDPRLGALLRPGNGNLPGAIPWAIDNGAFTGFRRDAFESLLGRCQGKPGCLWVAAPDVVADSAATLGLFAEWEPVLRAAGFPVALVSQDGLRPRDVPWDRIDCLFLGGSDVHKLGIEAHQLARAAKKRGKLVHVGRVNSQRRIRFAHNLSADSFDGGQFSRFPDRWIPWALKYMATIETGFRQGHIFDFLPEDYDLGC